MHRLAALAAVACALAARPARADGDDPRQLFGLSQPPPVAPAAADCSSGSGFACTYATDRLADAPPAYALSTWLSRDALLALPVADATHDSVASYALGAGTDGAGVVLGGATGAENRWTLDGAPIDGVRFGTAETRIPLPFLEGMLVTAGGFAARDRTSTGGTIDARLRRGGDTHVVEAYAWVGQAAASRAAPIPDAAYQIRSAALDAEPTITAAVVATGPLGRAYGGKAWYAAGIAPSLALDDVTWSAHRLVDANGDNTPDGFPGQLVTVPFEQYSRRTTPISVPAMLRAGWDRGPHAIDLTLLGSDAHSTRYLGNATLPASGVDATNVVADGVATYRGTWTDTRVKLQVAWHHSSHHESASDPSAADTPQTLNAYVPDNFPDAALVAGCAVGATAMFSPCPVPTSWLFGGGAGLLTDTSTDRPTITADVTRALGAANTLRAGVTDEDARLVTTERFTGGEEILSLFPGQTDIKRFIDASQPCPPDVSLPCTYAPSATTTYRTRYTAGYVEDTFQLAPNLVANGGLRWEMDQVGSALVFHDEPAPRLGITWDPLGGGRSRIWTSMGRSYALLAAGMGTTLLGTPAIADDSTAPFGNGRTITSGGAYAIAPGVAPMYQDEVTAGAEVAMPGIGRATTWAQARYLRQGFDTVGGTFENPGATDPTVPQAMRDTQVFAFELATPPEAPLQLRVGYTYTQAVGTWTGAYDPRQGIILFSGADYDFETGDQYGRLPTDLAHRVFFEAGKQHMHIPGRLELDVSSRFTLASGRPRDVLANSDEGVIELLPRGSDGRLPMTSQVNLHVAVRSTVHARGLALTLDLFNTFDRTDPTTVGELYASGEQSLRPIQGGTASDLIWLRSVDGLVPTREPSFRLPTAFQSPFTAVLGARYSF